MGHGHVQLGRHVAAACPSQVVKSVVTLDGKHVLTLSEDGTARVWLLSDGLLVRTLAGHTDRLLSACLTPDGGHVITTSADGTARVCPLSTVTWPSHGRYMAVT